MHKLHVTYPNQITVTNAAYKLRVDKALDREIFTRSARSWLRVVNGDKYTPIPTQVQKCIAIDTSCQFE